MAKLPATLKTKITKMFKGGSTINEIKAVIRELFPKITATRINVVIKKHLMKRANTLWSTAITQVGRCEYSGKKGKLEAHHLIGRQHLRYRWDLSNGICLNSYHHTLSKDFAAHGATDATQAFAEWMQQNRPGQWIWFQEHMNDNLNWKPTNEELLQICVELEEVIESGKRLRTAFPGKFNNCNRLPKDVHGSGMVEDNATTDDSDRERGSGQLTDKDKDR